MKDDIQSNQTEPIEPKNINKKKLWSIPNLMSYLALIISVGTILTYMYQNSLIKKHQYASVMPYLIIMNSTGERENGNLLDYSLSVWNNGVGPAFIDKVKIFFDEQEYENIFDFYNGVRPITQSHLNFSLNGLISKGYVLPPGQQLHLISANDTTSANFLERNQSDLKVEITYSSVYGKSWTSELGDLTPVKIK